MMSLQCTRHTNLFCYKYKETVISNVKPEDADCRLTCYADIQRNIYDEFIRQGVDQYEHCEFLDLSSLSSDKRTLIGYLDLNKPEESKAGQNLGVFVPSGVNLPQLINSAYCRVDGRFPIMTFLHRKKGNSLWRSSEIRKDAMNAHELADDISVIGKLSGITKKLFIWTGRDNSSTEAINYGYESKKLYLNTERKYYNFPTRQKLNRSFFALCRYSTNIKEKEIQKNIHSTGWMQMVEAMIWSAF